MNKNEFIDSEIEKNKKAFGRWHSSRRPNSADPMRLMFESPPKNKEEALQHCNALFNTGNYPICTDGCFNVGISGGCGTDCYVYKAGNCPEPNEIGG